MIKLFEIKNTKNIFKHIFTYFRIKSKRSYPKYSLEIRKLNDWLYANLPHRDCRSHRHLG